MSARQLRRAASRRRANGARRARRIALAGGASAGAMLSLAPGVQAAEFTVTNTLDSGPGSLRQAVLDAEAAPERDEITFTPAATGTITLTSGEIEISDPLRIEGPGAGELTISGDDSSRIFNFDPSSSDGFAVSGLHLTHGLAPSGDGGGAVSFVGVGRLRLSDVLIDESEATDTGGGVLFAGGLLVLEDSRISGNVASVGGGLTAYQGVSRIKRTTISGNEVAQAGGGVLTGLASMSIENSTISGNTSHAGGGPGNIGFGGGIVNYYGLELSIESTTITGNSAASGGGIASIEDADGPVLHNTIVAGNTAASGPDLYSYDGADSEPFVATFSLIGSTSGANLAQPAPESNVTGEDPELLPLAANGGFAPTHALADGSPALDAGDRGDFPATDQRGISRPQSLRSRHRRLRARGHHASQRPDHQATGPADLHDEPQAQGEAELLREGARQHLRVQAEGRKPAGARLQAVPVAPRLPARGQAGRGQALHVPGAGDRRDRERRSDPGSGQVPAHPDALSRPVAGT